MLRNFMIATLAAYASAADVNCTDTSGCTVLTQTCVITTTDGVPTGLCTDIACTADNFASVCTTNYCANDVCTACTKNDCATD